MKFCTRCGTQLSDAAAFCFSCGAPCNPVQPQPEPQPQPQQSPVFSFGNSDESFIDQLTGTVNKFTGGEGAVRPPLRKIFSQVLSKHSRKESEEIFVCGTATTTPVLSRETTSWPTPWLYTRILLAFAAAFVMLHILCDSFGNINGYPGLIIVGSFAVPVASLVFFFELNTPKNISFFTTIKIFLVGGCASLLLTMLLYGFVSVSDRMSYIDACLVSIVEELGKLGIVALFIQQEKTNRYQVNGLLIGAAVGAGFAAFESAGYAFRILLEYDYSSMIDNIFLRGVLAPGGHVVWAAMSGYAIMLVKGEEDLSLDFLTDKRFWNIFWMPFVLHAVWDMPIPIGTEICLVQIILCVLSWIIIFVMINNCLNEIAQILRAQEEEAARIAREALEEPVPAQEPQI